jgi:hypothetical protein
MTDNKFIFICITVASIGVAGFVAAARHPAPVAAPAPKSEFQQALDRAHWGKAEQDAANDRRREAEGHCDLFKLGNKQIPDDCHYRGNPNSVTITVTRE